MKILYGTGPRRIYLAMKFQAELERNGIQCMVVQASDIVYNFPSGNVASWFSNTRRFKRLVAEFKPDIVLSDSPTNFSLTAIKQGIPVLLYLHGDYWTEVEDARQHKYKSIIRRTVLDYRLKVADRCFEGAGMILPITGHLEGIVKSRLPDKRTCVFFSGIDTAEWNRVAVSRLKHPCVGLLQIADIWSKASEMLVLEKVIPRFPGVTFYWAGGGQFQNLILERLDKFPNFVWLGNLQYPDRVREFLSEIDLYALVTGLDMLPRSLLEAQLLARPVIATCVGGVEEAICDSRYLVQQGDADGLRQRIDLLLNDEGISAELGRRGQRHVLENFSVKRNAKGFAGMAAKFLHDVDASSHRP